MDPVNVLISLYKGYGLGDAVQMSAVLRHLRHYRPHWRIDFQAEPGRETVGYGIVDNVFCYGDPYPTEHYDREAQIILYDTITNWPDRPNTRVVSCLHERFGLEWDARFGSYQINLPQGVKDYVHKALKNVHRPVAIHYQGDSAKDKKDLKPSDISKICEVLKKFDYTPLILDWRKDPLPIIDGRTSVRTLGLEGGHSARINCAVISQCKAFIGIDSGPGKCASATTTQTAIIWTGHHPVPFHDPAKNTTHLVPVDYKGLEPQYKECRFFEANYNVRFYTNIVEEVTSWLKTLPS